MSMYFDLDELPLLLEYKTADLLSQYNFSGLSVSLRMCSPVTNFAAIIHGWMPRNTLQILLS